MKKILNILLLVLTLAAFLSLGGYVMYQYFHSSLNDVNLTISRNNENGFLDYQETHKDIMNICDTANNTQILMIPVDSVVKRLNSIPWITNVSAEINLKSYLDVEVTECEPIVRIYNKKGKSVYLDEDGNIFPTNNDYVPHLLVGSGNVDFPINERGNIKDENYVETDLPEIFTLMKEIVHDDYAKTCVKQVFKDKNKNYVFSLNNTNIIVIFGDVNNIKEKLCKLQHFFNKMQGSPELETYKEINLNFKNQVVCTKKKK
ncbi:MAG: hypothetical protein IJZ87_00685 [Bacteroidales bacterium]|nr:hypothetical protein [Bacteroidales bacterium]